MKEKSNKKKIFGIAGLFGFLTLILSSCNSFCSALDSATYRYAYDPVNTQFFDSKEKANTYVYNALTNSGKKEVYFSDKVTKVTTENVADLKVKAFNSATNVLEEKNIIEEKFL